MSSEVSNKFEKLVKENPDKYPSRMGQPWETDEVIKLLKYVKENKSHSEIAELHERTIGSISSKLRSLAYEYHCEGRSLEKIMKFTGLSKEIIEATIQRNQNKIKISKENLKSIEHINLSELISELKEIKVLLKTLVEHFCEK